MSKSTFLRGLQCPKSLYLHKFIPQVRDPLDMKTQEIFRRGHEVGKLAQSLFPGGVDVSPASPARYRSAVDQTSALIERGERVIYEAAFLFNDVLCYMDILVNEGNQWRAYEVKSSTGITEAYIHDISVQYYIITGSGMSLSDISLVHINSDYIRQGDLDINTLFTIHSVLDEARDNQAYISDQVERLKKVLAMKRIPDIDIGEHCFKPYDCDFHGYCWQHVPENSVFDISRLRKKEAFRLYNEGIIRIEEVTGEHSLSYVQQLQVEYQNRNEPFINREGIREFLDTIEFPLFYMDFETFMPAVPLFDNSSPYQQIPFQYSLHYQKERGSEPIHREFLAEPGSDPRQEFIRRLLADTREAGDILVYNKSFECTRLSELARDFPDYAPDIEMVLSRIKDLMVPFQRKCYYHPLMKGSYSIKAVLPALVAELHYNDLQISSGSTAMFAYERLQSEENIERIRIIRENLLEYCKLDTLAMVRILERLWELIQ